MEKHPLEAKESWSIFQQRKNEDVTFNNGERNLHKHFDSGIKEKTVHGMMIDAGSQGTRIHVYEFDRRSLSKRHQVQDALSGRLLSFPKSDSRWTNRLKPGLSTFSGLPDDQVVQGIAEYLQPLMDFAKSVLRTKKKQFESFPIYLKATGGMRILDPSHRARVMQVVRDLFYNKTYCPFWFEEERARVISGEEEAIYDWAGVNFLMGTLLEDSEGVGTVLNPRLTYGALDLGGASTQISFYEPDGDIMANLFKLQIGPGRHWNVYCHSFLYYGIDQATFRLAARLADGSTTLERNVDGVYNPCLPGGASKVIRTNIHLATDGSEIFVDSSSPTSNSSDDGFYSVLLKNGGGSANFDACMDVTLKLLHLEKNEWCNFSHKGDCSFAGIYQPDLPYQSSHFGEFIAFSNFFEVWDFLQLPARASMDDLLNQAEYLCSMNVTEFMEFNNGRIDDDEEVIDYCFRSVYIYRLLHDGYGFEDNEYVTALNVISGLKVGWALGSILYEINTLPWEYSTKKSSSKKQRLLPMVLTSERFDGGIVGWTLLVSSLFLLLALWRRHQRRDRRMYEPIGNVEV